MLHEFTTPACIFAYNMLTVPLSAPMQPAEMPASSQKQDIELFSRFAVVYDSTCCIQYNYRLCTSLFTADCGHHEPKESQTSCTDSKKPVQCTETYQMV